MLRLLGSGSTRSSRCEVKSAVGVMAKPGTQVYRVPGSRLRRRATWMIASFPRRESFPAAPIYGL